MSLREHRGWGTPQTPRDSQAGDPAPNFLPQSHQGGRVSREWMPALGKGEDRRAQGDLGRDRADTLLPQPKLEASSGPGPLGFALLPARPSTEVLRRRGDGCSHAANTHRRSVRHAAAPGGRGGAGAVPGSGPGGLDARAAGRGAQNASHRQLEEESEAWRRHVLLLKGAQTRGTADHRAAKTGGGQASRGPRAHA